MKKVILILMILWSFIVLASGNFEDIRSAAEKGDIKAQNTLGFMYYSGEGVDENLKQAFYWYEKVAEKGDPDYQNEAASAYYYVRNLNPRYLERSIYWSEKAAEGGNVKAMSRLGSIYNKKLDYDKTLYWYEKAAETGERHGLYAASFYFGLTKSKLRNYDKVDSYLEKIAEAGGSKEFYPIGDLYYRRYKSFNYNQNQNRDTQLIKAYAWINASYTQNKKTYEKKFRDRILKDLTPEQVVKGDRLTEEICEKYCK